MHITRDYFSNHYLIHLGSKEPRDAHYKGLLFQTQPALVHMKCVQKSHAMHITRYTLFQTLPALMYMYIKYFPKSRVMHITRYTLFQCYPAYTSNMSREPCDHITRDSLFQTLLAFIHQLCSKEPCHTHYKIPTFPNITFFSVHQMFKRAMSSTLQEANFSHTTCFNTSNMSREPCDHITRDSLF
jgi:hypothetical protein